MLRLLTAFQQKLVIPTFCLAVGIGIAGYFMIWSTPVDQGIGFGYFLAGPLAHYFIYELRDENEYYFYFNKGLSKTILYCSTCALNILIGVLILSCA